MTIYDLKLHEILTLDDYSVMRVPGGWIYHYMHADIMCFVPFDNDMMPTGDYNKFDLTT